MQIEDTAGLTGQRYGERRFGGRQSLFSCDISVMMESHFKVFVHSNAEDTYLAE